MPPRPLTSPPPRDALRVVLASKSPRRRKLLAEHGIPFEVAPELLDDRGLRPGSVEPEAWVMSLAFLKASAAADHLPADFAPDAQVVLGADTICVSPEGDAVGQPRDRADAERTLRAFFGREHRVLTGVALLEPLTRRRALFFDAATVRMGRLGDAELAAYLDSGGWEGKAGAYNLSERLEEGWPIEYEGDPTSIMGLPMDRLVDCLAAFAQRTQAA